MTSDYRRRQRERSRDSITTRIEDQQLARVMRRRDMATKRKTSYGDTVPKWPSTDTVFALIEEVDKELRSLFNEAAERSETDNTIDQRGKQATAARFNVLGGQ